MSVDDLKAASLASLSCERAFLDRMERLTRRWSAGSVVLTAFGVLALTRLLPDIPGLVGGLALFFGVGLAWSGTLWLRRLPPAREALKMQPIDVLLERRYQLSRVEAWRARLWATDGRERPLAWFGSTQWSTPMFMTADKARAKVYGALTRGSVVVVSCSQGVLVGRINLSHVGDNQEPTIPPRGLGWLFKPIWLPFSRR